jgi:GR25 family glycosyltransferase involved in LPS biosynthesis
MPIKIEDLPCVCISLVRRPDRWTRFASQPELKALPNLRRFDAVDGKKISLVNDTRINAFTKKNILTGKRRSHYELDSIGGVGCALSHIGVWKEFLDSGASHILVFEDDAIVYPGFVNKVNNALKSLEERKLDFDLIVLTRAFRARNKIQSALHDLSEADAFVLAHCYILTRKAAQIFHEEALPISGHIDLYMSAQIQNRDMKLFCSTILASPQAGQASDIVTKPKCYICDVPSDYEKTLALIPQWDLTLARTSEVLLGVVVVAWISHQAFAWFRSK